MGSAYSTIDNKVSQKVRQTKKWEKKEKSEKGRKKWEKREKVREEEYVSRARHNCWKSSCPWTNCWLSSPLSSSYFPTMIIATQVHFSSLDLSSSHSPRKVSSVTYLFWWPAVIISVLNVSKFDLQRCHQVVPLSSLTLLFLISILIPILIFSSHFNPENVIFYHILIPKMLSLKN